MAGELEQVVIRTPDPVAPDDHQQKMIDLVDSRNAAAIDRPEWLPTKFATVEDMAASYKELEAKLGANAGTPAADATPVVVPAVDPKAAPVLDPLAIPAVAADDAQAAAVVASAGLDMAALNAEYAKDGKLSEASLAALAAKGVDKATVDSYIEGRGAVKAAFELDVKGATPGGADKYADMIEWAKVNLSQPEIDAYNAATSTNNKEQAKLAVAGLGVKYAAAVGSEPPLVGGKPNAGPSDVYESIAQMKTDMADKRYKTDPAFRRSVAEKLGRSSIM